MEARVAMREQALKHAEAELALRSSSSSSSYGSSGGGGGLAVLREEYEHHLRTKDAALEEAKREVQLLAAALVAQQ